MPVACPSRGAWIQTAFGFVAVTNFDVKQARTAQIVLTDPRAKDLSAAPKWPIHLPRLPAPPHESVVLPARVPLANPCWQMAPGIGPGDEVFYATAELSKVVYDGTALNLGITSPTLMASKTAGETRGGGKGPPFVTVILREGGPPVYSTCTLWTPGPSKITASHLPSESTPTVVASVESRRISTWDCGAPEPLKAR
jgi:hypothetical protein